MVAGTRPSASWVHADIHELEYTSSGTLYSANDGGTYYFNGSSWTSLNAQRNTAEIYRLGLSSLTQNLWLTGHQDNGTNKKNGANYNHVAGADGMDCFIDRTNDLTMYSASQNGGLRRSTNGGLSWVSVTSGLSGTGAWVTPWKQDPQNANTIYTGYSQLFKSTAQAADGHSLVPREAEEVLLNSQLRLPTTRLFMCCMQDPYAKQ